MASRPTKRVRARLENHRPLTQRAELSTENKVGSTGISTSALALRCRAMETKRALAVYSA